MTGVDAVARGDRRQEASAGIVIAGAVLVIGWASGLGILTGSPFASAQEPVPTTGPPDATVVLTEKPFVPTSTALPVGAGTAPTVLPAAGPTAVTPTSPAGPGTTPTGGTPAAPSTPAAPGAPTAPGSPTEECSTGAAEAALDPLLVHVQAAHLQTSPGQQVADLLNVDAYVKAHTVLVDSMLAPAQASVTGACG